MKTREFFCTSVLTLCSSTTSSRILSTIFRKFCIWWWTLAVEMPASTFNLLKEYGVQNYFTFNPTNNKELVSNSRTQVIYYLWYEEGDILAHSASRLTEKMAVKDVLTNYSAHLPC
ncbi:cilia- and flagella-associated protein 251-like isoform X3 [Mustela erminea]|nr:cilia- and flagella-associated protein 251-like isoform X3 [Mustela erminea]